MAQRREPAHGLRFPPDQAEDFVAELQQVLREIAAVLPGNAGDQSFFHGAAFFALVGALWICGMLPGQMRFSGFHARAIRAFRGDNSASMRSRFSRNHLTVRAIPSSNGTVGSNPRTARARVVSAWRCRLLSHVRRGAYSMRLLDLQAAMIKRA